MTSVTESFAPLATCQYRDVASLHGRLFRHTSVLIRNYQQCLALQTLQLRWQDQGALQRYLLTHVQTRFVICLQEIVCLYCVLRRWNSVH